MDYEEFSLSEDPTRRRLLAAVAWVCNASAVIFGAYSIYQYSSFLVFVTTALYCVNIYVLSGDYKRWHDGRPYIFFAALMLVGVNLVSTAIECYGMYKAKREDYQSGYWLLLARLILNLAIVVATFGPTYFLYPDQLTLLSEQHPAAGVFVKQTVIDPEQMTNSTEQ